MTVLFDVMGCGQSTPSSRHIQTPKADADNDDVYQKSHKSGDTNNQRQDNDKDRVAAKSSKNSQNSMSSEKVKRSSANSGSHIVDDSYSEDSGDRLLLDSRTVNRTSMSKEKAGPFLQPQPASVETESLLEFFRVLDEKIEQGQDYVTES